MGTHFPPCISLLIRLCPNSSLSPNRWISFYALSLWKVEWGRRVPKSQTRCLREKGVHPGIRRELGFTNSPCSLLSWWLCFPQSVLSAHRLIFIPFLDFWLPAQRAEVPNFRVWIWGAGSSNKVLWIQISKRKYIKDDMLLSYWSIRSNFHALWPSAICNTASKALLTCNNHWKQLRPSQSVLFPMFLFLCVNKSFPLMREASV